MANLVKAFFLEQLRSKYGNPKQLPGSLSLFEVGAGLARVYIRYSKVHGRNRTFFGLRQDDLKQLEGFNSAICFLWDTQTEPIFIPFADFEDIFHALTPASDGQYKVQIYPDDETELYIANAGRFNIEGFYGWHNLDSLIDKNRITVFPDLSHSQVQTLIGSIGFLKGYDIWVPLTDRNKLDWSLAEEYACRGDLPARYGKVDDIVREVDVLWMRRGSSDLRAIFEVEQLGVDPECWTGLTSGYCDSISSSGPAHRRAERRFPAPNASFLCYSTSSDSPQPFSPIRCPVHRERAIDSRS
jgi:hypothetical protein